MKSRGRPPKPDTASVSLRLKLDVIEAIRATCTSYGDRVSLADRAFRRELNLPAPPPE